MSYVNDTGIQTYLVANPLPELAHTTRTDANFAAMLESIENLADSFPNISLLFPHPRNHDGANFATLNHLRPEAVTENTIQIVDQIDLAR